MQEIGEILFALSSPDRLKLLTDIEKEDLRLTELSKRLSATVQETSRHLGRLVDVRLIAKDSRGCYRLTPLGRLALDLLPGFSLLSKNAEYFLTHDISFLPQAFTDRIGELSDNHYVDHVGNVLTECEHLVRGAEQYFWFIMDQPLPLSIFERFSRETVFRGIFASDITTDEYAKAKTMFGNRADLRLRDRVGVAIGLNEKMAAVCFSDSKGKVDFSCGFIGYNSAFHKWCYDLFSYYWENPAVSHVSQSASEISRPKSTSVAVAK